jgi:hypothetical protein
VDSSFELQAQRRLRSKVKQMKTAIFLFMSLLLFGGKYLMSIDLFYCIDEISFLSKYEFSVF